jgi:hypothetical protein
VLSSLNFALFTDSHFKFITGIYFAASHEKYSQSSTVSYLMPELVSVLARQSGGGHQDGCLTDQGEQREKCRREHGAFGSAVTDGDTAHWPRTKFHEG